nr:unnamed protein product [Digitaria exilis]
MPGHIRRPEPNGNSSKSCPFTSKLLPTNLSGRNSSAACPHTAGSRPMAQTLTNTSVREARDAPLRDKAFTADDTIQLLGGLGESGWVPQELRHGPFNGH